MKARFQAAKKKFQTKTITNIFWLFTDHVIRVGVGLYVSILVMRYLGITQFGLLSFATAWVSLFSPFTTLGIASLVIRDVASAPKNKEEVLGTAFWLQVAGGVVTLVLSTVALILLRQGEQTVLGLVVILSCAGLFQSFKTIDLWFQSQVESKYSVVAKNIAFAVVALVKVVLVLNEAPIFAFAVTTLIEAILGGLCLVILYKRRGYSLRAWKWRTTIAKALIREGWPLILSGLAVNIYLRIDQIMLGEIVGAQAVGLYSAAIKISEQWYFLPTAIVSSVAPSIYAYAKSGDRDKYYQRLSQLLRVLALVSTAIALPMTFISKGLVTLLFGDSYAAAGSILSIHIWAALFVFTGVGTAPWFTSEGLTHLSFRRTLLGAISNIGLNLVLIPAYAGNGAAVATVISYAISALLYSAIDKRTRKLFYIQIKSLFFIS